MSKPLKQGLICVAIAAIADGRDPQAQVVSTIQRMQSVADVLEIRLDSMVHPQISNLMGCTVKPLLFTNRPIWEGGGFKGDERERLDMLLEATELGAAYVDIELKTDINLRKELLTAAAKTKSKLIISWHDFQGTPSGTRLAELLEEQSTSGAHIGKIVTMAHDFADVLRVLNLQTVAAEKQFPLIAFCMGRTGMISRVATLGLGGYMTYGAADDGLATAPGQLHVSTLRKIIDSINQTNV